MSEFYEDMADMVNEIMATEELGQRGIRLIREVRGEVDPAAPWLGTPVERQQVNLRGAAKGVDELADGESILSTDVLVTAAIPTIPFQLQDGVTLRMELNGVTYSVVSVATNPRAGVPVSVSFIVRNGHVNPSNPPI